MSKRVLGPQFYLGNGAPPQKPDGPPLPQHPYGPDALLPGQTKVKKP